MLEEYDMQNHTDNLKSISVLRVLATLCVFMLHTWIFTKHLVDLNGGNVQVIFKTPAWAGV